MADPLNDPAHEEQDLGELGTLLAQGVSAPSIEGGGATSDLSLDEILLLHTIGLKPSHVVWGIGAAAIPSGSFVWSTGQVAAADQAFSAAFEQAKSSIRSQAAQNHSSGVVGIEIEFTLHSHYLVFAMTGTAVVPIADPSGHTAFKVRYDSPFLSDLSARDFALLSASGWYPTDLVAGASFVHAPRRSMGQAIGQSTQNVELTNMTETLYDAREAAMERLQQGMIRSRGTGLVDAKVFDHPVRFAGHVIQFVIWGTAITLVADTHQHPQLSVVVPLDERVRQFEAHTLG